MLTAVVAALGRVPRWAWAVLLGAALVAGAWWWHASAVNRAVLVAVEAERAQLRAAAALQLAEAQGRAIEQQTQATMAWWEIERESNQRERRAGADAAAARGALDRLRSTLAALRGRPDAATESAGPDSLNAAAPALADALSECSGRYTALAATVDQLAGQVSDWQAYGLEVLPRAGVEFVSP